MKIKEVWKVFKGSSMNDKDMQRAFENSATPNACIELLQENEELQRRIAEFEEIVKAVAHIGVDFGYGEYQLEQKHIDKARKLRKENKDDE